MIVLMSCDPHVLVYLHIIEEDGEITIDMPIIPSVILFFCVCGFSLGDGMLKMKNLFLRERLFIFSFIVILFS